MKRMEEFLADGGTIVFVSHAMQQVAKLCQQCVWLDHGQLLYQGKTQDAVKRYMALVEEREEEEFKRKHPNEWAIMEAERAEKESKTQFSSLSGRTGFTGAALYNSEGRIVSHLNVGEPSRVRISYKLDRVLPNPVFCLEILRDDDLHMFATNTYQHDLILADLPREGHIYMDMPFMSLNEGKYRIRLTLFPNCNDDNFHLEFLPEDQVENALAFEVCGGRFAHGCTYLPVEWQRQPTLSVKPLVAG